MHDEEDKENTYMHKENESTEHEFLNAKSGRGKEPLEGQRERREGGEEGAEEDAGEVEQNEGVVRLPAVAHAVC